MTAAPAPRPIDDEARAAQQIVAALSEAFSAKVVGQEHLRESLLIGLLTSGHVLLESVPGLAKTTAARVIAESIDGEFRRIQCTPDLLPSDIIGTQVYDATASTGATFVTQLGPVHANVVLLDEINRSSAKTQSAMLEAMEERQTTIAGTVYPIPEPFLVIATQNPVDQEGTYALSEAQTDRFLIKEIVTYPSPEEEVEVLIRRDTGLYDRNHHTRPVASLEDIRRVQRVVRDVYLSRDLMLYASRLVGVTRDAEKYLPNHVARLVEYGASPRATIALCTAARALAVLSGRHHVLPGDIADLAHRVLQHRLILGFEAASAGVSPGRVIDAALNAVRVP
jgi:MoxR-like ATPase